MLGIGVAVVVGLTAVVAHIELAHAVVATDQVRGDETLVPCAVVYQRYTMLDIWGTRYWCTGTCIAVWLSLIHI